MLGYYENYDEQAVQELFGEQWVSRDVHNDLLDKYQRFEKEVGLVKERLVKLDDLIDECNSLKDVMDYSLIQLRKSSLYIERASDILLEDIEKAMEGE